MTAITMQSTKIVSNEVKDLMTRVDNYSHFRGKRNNWMNFLANQYIPGIQEYREKLEHKKMQIWMMCVKMLNWELRML